MALFFVNRCCPRFEVRPATTPLRNFAGKTSLMLRFSEDKFSSSLLATAGVDYKTQFLDVDGKRIKCQIW
jgi:hypothetical protein